MSDIEKEITDLIMTIITKLHDTNHEATADPEKDDDQEYTHDEVVDILEKINDSIDNISKILNNIHIRLRSTEIRLAYIQKGINDVG